MRETAIVVTADAVSIEDGRLERLLQFFGIDYRRVTAAELDLTDTDSVRLICSAAAFAQIADRVAPESIHSAFVYGHEAGARKECGSGSTWTISDDPVAGALRGLRVTSQRPSRLAALPAAQPMISAGPAVAFARSEMQGVPVFTTAAGLIDLDAELATPNFDLRDHLFSAAPAVMYLRWAFPKSAWHSPETNACLIIDDPLLRPRYGFIRFRELLEAMERCDFSTCIAFIPWNWRRNAPKTTRLFKDNPRRFSLAVHGCDHTAAEFGSDDPERLRHLTTTANTRMLAHERETELEHARVMVFPQGVFSDVAVSELKRGGFEAIVNTEVKSVDSRAPKLTIADVWKTALMRYHDFPIFTRRYPRQGVENLAFDILLGKPCLIVIHHDFCSDNYKRLLEFIRQVNALKAPLIWRSLGQVVKRGYRLREIADDQTEVEMFSASIFLKNDDQEPRRFRIRRQEHDPAAVRDVRIDGAPLPWERSAEQLQFDVALAAGEEKKVEVLFHPHRDPARNGQDDATAALKTRMRRYLSEVRDNYVTPAKARLKMTAN